MSRAVRCCRHVNGNHYGLTSEAWLQNLDQHREAALPILADIYKKCEDGGAAPSHLPQPPCLRCFGHPPSRRRGTNRLTRGGGGGGAVAGTPEEIGLRWFGRWRAFFLACAECFAWQGGDEWFVSHYLFENNLK